MAVSPRIHLYFFFTDPAPTDISTLSLHDALPISAADLFDTARLAQVAGHAGQVNGPVYKITVGRPDIDRKSTRLNSSHRCISYAVFCLKKKKSTVIYSGNGQQIVRERSPAPTRKY